MLSCDSLGGGVALLVLYGFEFGREVIFCLQSCLRRKLAQLALQLFIAVRRKVASDGLLATVPHDVKV